MVPNPLAPKSPPEEPPVPKAGLLAVLPNKPPPVDAPPNGEEVLAVVLLAPKPPKPVEEPAVAVLLPNKPPPLVEVPPNGFAAPKRDV